MYATNRGGCGCGICQEAVDPEHVLQHNGMVCLDELKNTTYECGLHVTKPSQHRSLHRDPTVIQCIAVYLQARGSASQRISFTLPYDSCSR